VGASHDPLERQADRIADAVVDGGPRRHSGRVQPVRNGSLQRKCACGSGATTGQCEACDEETVQRKETSAAAGAQIAPPLVHTVLEGGGGPLEGRTRRLMESRFGADFGHVRVHADAQAAESARQVHGLAYTVGSHIVFGSGQYAPGSRAGDRLIAHELVHTLQQGVAARGLQRVCYDESCEELGGARPAAPLSAATSDEGLVDPDWRTVNELGIAYKEGARSQDGGATLRAGPGGAFLEWIPRNTKVFVLKANDAKKAFAVTRVDGPHTFGYVHQDYLKLHLPDPEARIWKIKPGESSLSIVRDHYRGHFNDAWYADMRYAVNALYWANAHQRHKPADPAIEKKDTWVVKKVPPFGTVRILVKADSEDAPWDTVQVKPGYYLWLPGVEYLRSLYDVVREKGGGTGSIKAEVWQTVKGIYNKAAYALAFAAGIIHGFFKSIWDAISGIAQLIYGFLRSLLSGDLISDIKDLAGGIQKLLSKEGREAAGEAIATWAAEWDAKLRDPSPWTAGHAHGYLTGYVMAEAAMLLLSFGGTAALKGALWTSRVGKLVKGSRAIETLEKLVAKGASVSRAADARFQRAVDALKANRYGKAAVGAAETTARAITWTARGVAQALSLPGRMIVHLTDAAINRVKQLQDLFPRIKALSDRAKWWLFGCHSPCRINVKQIRNTFKNLTDDEIEAAVKLIDPKTLGPKPGARTTLKATPGAVHLDLPDVIDVARARLKAAGVAGLHPKKYGTRLHAEVDAVLEETLGTVPKGWNVGSETQISSLITMDPKTASLTVRQYMQRSGMSKRFPSLRRKFLNTKVGKLKPDLYVRAPDGRTMVWDLTSRPTPEHLAKSAVYAEVIGRETGGFIRIAEDFWRKVF
jgi:hypothetical protein